MKNSVRILIFCILALAVGFILYRLPSPELVIYDDITLAEEFSYFQEELGPDCNIYSQVSDSFNHACSVFITEYPDSFQTLDFQLVVGNKTNQDLKNFSLSFSLDDEYAPFIVGPTPPLENLNTTTLVPYNKKTADLSSNTYAEISYLLKPRIDLNSLPGTFTITILGNGEEEVHELSFDLQKRVSEKGFQRFDDPYQEVLEEINAKYGTDMRFATEEEKASYVNKAIIDCYSKEYGVDFQSVEEILEYPEAQKNIPSFEEWRADMWQEAREISLRKEAQGKANS
ncbi:MAG: hypothetical protein VB085_03850 [Peptococcaceae bacterium]|nr:hypothetical protein [Peptococcaceae bacterium]